MEKQPKRLKLVHRIAALVLMIGMVAAMLSQSVFARNSYVITDGDNVTVHQSYSTDPDVVLDEVGIELSEEDTYTTSYNDGVSRIDIQRMQLVTIDCRGEQRVVGTYGETVEQLLERIGVELQEEDQLSCPVDTLTYDGMTFSVVRTEVRYESFEEVIPYVTNYYTDPELEAEEEIVLVQGADGLVKGCQKVTYQNGREISRETVSQSVVTEMVRGLVVRSSQGVLKEQPDAPEYVNDGDQNGVTGSRISGKTITTSSGMTYDYSYTLDVTCTAYSCEGYTGITATGTVARVGAVAVDPRYIPLGTKMYIVSNDGQYVYGYCVAEDTGGSIKGMKIDLYFDTVAECWDFGVRSCTVYVIED